MRCWNAGSTDRNHVTSWRRRFSFTPGKRAGRDWNFETPGTVPGADTPSTVQLPRNGDYELYEYPARALDAAGNERASRLRMQSVEADHEALNGTSTVRTLAPGARLTLYDFAHPEHAFETAALLSVHHRALDPTYETGPGEPSYENRFTALPARLPATPHRATPRPRIDGSQIALVAGPEGEEIHTDPHGRVKLWFPWDRRARKDGSDTKWVRVAQPWAGGSWGAQVIPRIGMEAVISFEGGDPDRPIVTALVPNPQQKVPYTLPANKTKTVLRTNTHRSGTPLRFNELSFEDEAGREEIFMHAQKDMTLKIENHATERVDANKIFSVGRMFLTEVEESMAQNVGRNLAINVGSGGQGNIVGGDLRSDMFGMRPAGYFLDQSLNEHAGSGNFSLNAAGAITISATNSIHTDVEGMRVSSVGADHIDNVAGSTFVSAGRDSKEVTGGTKMIDAHGQLHLRCGKSEIVMKPDGSILLKGVRIEIEGRDGVLVTSQRIDLNK